MVRCLLRPNVIQEVEILIIYIGICLLQCLVTEDEFLQHLANGIENTLKDYQFFKDFMDLILRTARENSNHRISASKVCNHQWIRD